MAKTLSNTLRPNCCCLNFIHILYPRYYPKITGHILKNKQKNKCVCIHEIKGLITTKMKMNVKNRSHRYDINRPRSRHRHKYSKYKKLHSILCVKQHLSNLKLSSWESKATVGLNLKKALLLKKAYVLRTSKFSLSFLLGHCVYHEFKFLYGRPLLRCSGRVLVIVCLSKQWF